MTQKTHFGYQQVTPTQKTQKVADVFHSVAANYDLMNDLMSLGMHRLWKQAAINLSDVRAGQTVLDLAGGTGDLTHQFATLVGQQGKVVLADINLSMLNHGRRRLIDAGKVANVHYVNANAECLPFPANYFDCICIGFGLRNVTHKEKALTSIYHALKPGGTLLILEFSHPKLPGLKPLYALYSFAVLPCLGKIVSNDAPSYRYLAESIRMHPDQETLTKMIQEAGFENCTYFNLAGGIVAIHRAHKF